MTTGTGTDEIGQAMETSGGGTGGEEEIDANECLVGPDNGNYGFRHHCGGDMTFGFTGQADGHNISKSYSFGFGPTYADDEVADYDTYETPIVAACCGGPYDFQQVASSQQTYFVNCKLDAVQQMCATMPQWLIKLAEDYPLAQIQLYDAAELLGDAQTQTECVLALYENVGAFNEVNDTSWDISVGNSTLTVEIDLVEILSIDYDTPPEECESIYENDSTLLPLLTSMESGATLDVLTLDSGSVTLTDDDGFSDTITPTEGYMSVAELRNGDVELRNVVLRDPASITLVVDSTTYIVDTWNVALIGPVTNTPRLGVSTFPAGSVSFAMSVVYDGGLYRAGGTNAEPFTLEQASVGGWELDGLELEFIDDTTTWTFTNSSTLVFL